MLVKSLLHSVFSLITWIKKVLTKQPVERPQQILANYGHISWKAFELLRSFFEAFKISWFIWESIFDHFQVLLTWLLTVFLNSNVNKTVWFFLVSRNREILMMLIVKMLTLVALKDKLEKIRVLNKKKCHINDYFMLE